MNQKGRKRFPHLAKNPVVDWGVIAQVKDNIAMWAFEASFMKNALVSFNTLHWIGCFLAFCTNIIFHRDQIISLTEEEKKEIAQPFFVVFRDLEREKRRVPFWGQPSPNLPRFSSWRVLVWHLTDFHSHWRLARSIFESWGDFQEVLQLIGFVASFEGSLG